MRNSKARTGQHQLWLFPGIDKAKLKDIAYSGFRSYSRPNALYSQEELNILRDFRNDSNIVIMKPDKGNGVVILDKHDYNKKMDEILSDTSKFELLNDDAIKITLKRENQFKTLLKKLKADNCINDAYAGYKKTPIYFDACSLCTVKYQTSVFIEPIPYLGRYPVAP